MAAHPRSPALNFLAGGGEMGRRIRAFDWAASPLGKPAFWPQSLKTAVRLLLTSGHPMFIWWGPQLTQFYNDAYSQCLGPERHPGALGQPGREWWEETWPIIGHEIAQVMAGGGAVWHVDALVPITRHGALEDVYWTYSFSPIHDSNAANGVGGVLVITSETTAQVESERRMADKSRHQQLLLKQMPGFVAVLTGPGHVFDYVNDAYRAIAGLREFEGRTVRDVFPDLAGQGFNELLDRVYANGASYSAQAQPVRFMGEDEDRFLDFIYEPIRDERGQVSGIFVGGYDVSAQVRAQVALKRANEALAQANATLEARVAAALREREALEAVLVQSQKMEAVGQLTGGLAHDFNNMLAGISGNLELLGKKLEAAGSFDLRRYVDKALHVTRRAAALTHRLLAFSRRQTLDPKPVAANALIHSMEELLQRTLGPDIALHASLEPQLWVSLCDPNQLENAILNLAINGRDAMPHGGRLLVQTANVALDQTELAGSPDALPGEYVHIQVADNGQGMSPDILVRALDPFFTTKPIGQGTGLGLSMVYGFVKQSRGHLRIDSRPGSGTSIHMYLPRLAGEVPALAGEDESSRFHLPQIAHAVLLVEDEPSVRAVAAEMLADLGLMVHQAGDAGEALRVFSRLPALDLLITDVGLPNGMNGRQLADAMRALRPGLKVLFVTGYAPTTVLGDTMLEEGMQMLTKPYSLEQFAGKVSGMIEPGHAQAGQSKFAT